MASYKEISPVEVYKLNQESGGLRILDVRSAEEYEEVHAAIAVHLALESVHGESVSSMEFSKDDAVFVICRSGARSAKACEILNKEGFKNLFNIVGGTMAWADAGLPVCRATKGAS